MDLFLECVVFFEGEIKLPCDFCTCFGYMNWFWWRYIVRRQPGSCGLLWCLNLFFVQCSSINEITGLWSNLTNTRARQNHRVVAWDSLSVVQVAASIVRLAASWTWPLRMMTWGFRWRRAFFGKLEPTVVQFSSFQKGINVSVCKPIHFVFESLGYVI